MSVLIDKLLFECTANGAYRRVDDKMFLAKPCDFYGLATFINRFKDAFRVLVGKSKAYHYWEDIDER